MAIQVGDELEVLVDDPFHLKWIKKGMILKVLRVDNLGVAVEDTLALNQGIYLYKREIDGINIVHRGTPMQSYTFNIGTTTSVTTGCNQTPYSLKDMLPVGTEIDYDGQKYVITSASEENQCYMVDNGTVLPVQYFNKTYKLWEDSKPIYPFDNSKYEELADKYLLD